MDTNILIQILIIIVCISASVALSLCAIKNYRLQKNTAETSAKVIGYKYYKSWGGVLHFLNVTNSVSYFIPLVEYKDGDKTITSLVKNITPAVNIGQTLTLKLHEERHISSQFLGLLAVSIFLLSHIPLALIEISKISGNQELLNFIISISPVLIVIYIICALMCLAQGGLLSEKEEKKLKSWSKVKLKERFKKPKNHQNYSLSDFKAMESSDMISYDDMIAYNYQHRTNPVGWCILIIICTLFYWIFFKPII